MKTIAIACLNRKRHEEEKLNKINDTKEYPITNKPFLVRIRDSIIDFYASYQEYCHIEIAFPIENSKTGECYSYSVYSDDYPHIKKRKRTFSNPAYDWISLCVSEKEYETVERFCSNKTAYAEITREKIYDENSLFLSQIWPVTKENRYWCVSFVIEALQKIGMFKYYNKNTFTVDEAVAILRKHNRKSISIKPKILADKKTSLDKKIDCPQTNLFN